MLRQFGPMSLTYILTLSCPDRPGIVHAVSGFLFDHGGNIEEAAQYNDHGTGLFFMRVQFACDQFTHDELTQMIGTFAQPFAMNWKLHATAQPMRTVILVSKEGHCLNDLMFRWKSGLLPLDIRAIVSNHREFYQLAARAITVLEMAASLGSVKMSRTNDLSILSWSSGRRLR